MNFRKISLLLITASVMIAACNKSNSAPDKKPVRDDKQPVMIEVLQPRTLNEYITVSGKLEGATDVSMSSETSGRILQLYKKLGDKINKGEKIGMVDNEIYRIRKEQAEAALEIAQLNLTTSENLFASKAISQVEYNNALAAFKGAKANLESAVQAYDNSYLTAPESGVISNLMVSVGQFINYGTPIAFITNDNILIIKTGVGESQVGKIRKGQQVNIFAPGKDEPVKGFIKGYGIRPLLSSASYPVEIQLNNASGLLPGMVVTARILSGTYKTQLFTSINNIIKEYDRNYVYVVNDKDVAVRREVILGKIIGEDVIILSGVDIGDRIVVSGMENLEDDTPVQIRS